jgi:diguanylate cyclase (GGDEF)-like protein
VSGTAHTAPPRVLVIDDDAMTLALVAEALESDGFVVEQAENGADGLVRFRGERPDLVLLDVNMPRMDGFECLQWLRHLPDGERVPIVMLTGQNDDASVALAYEAGATDFIAKPLSWQLLRQRVRYLLRASYALEQLARSEASLAHAQGLAHLGNWEWVPGAPSAHWSGELHRILGERTDRPETLATFMAHVPAADQRKVGAAFAGLLKRGTAYTLEHRILRSDGAECVVLQQADAVTDCAGRVMQLRGTVQDITESKRHEAQLGYLATHDSLTGLPNRILLTDRLRQATAYAQRQQRRVAVVFVDLDRFKFINDSLGHAIGDKVLQAIAKRLRECVRESDTVARLGGDEFVLVLNDQNTDDVLFQTVKRIVPSVARPLALADHEIAITCSLGIAIYPQDGADADTLLRHADIAMYRAKTEGRDRFEFFTAEMTTAIAKRVAMESGMRHALERGEFRLHYQPQVDLATGAIVGVEALIRWQHPEYGMVPPGDFIPLAEETGLISPIGEWVLRAACAQAKAWHEQGLPPLPIAVNLSARQFAHPHAVEIVAGILRETGLPPRYLELELTESVSMDHPEKTIVLLRRFREMGVRVTIDDFGTGYSNLNYLKHFPVDRLKLDRSFTHGMARDPHDLAICRAVIAMAHSLGMRVIAEGVETPAQLALLHGAGSDEIQGYLFSRPLEADALAVLLREGRRLTPAGTDKAPYQRTLLLVDDEAGVLASLKRLLRKRYRLLSANNAAEAFELMATHDIGVILCDQQMPEMDGIEFLSRVRLMYPDTRRILLSGCVAFEVARSALNLGAVHKFLVKPWDNDELVRELDEAFRAFDGATLREVSRSAA